MKIAFGTDLSEESFAAARWAHALASKSDDAQLTGVFVVSQDYEELPQSLLDDPTNSIRLKSEIVDAIKPHAKAEVELREGSTLGELLKVGESQDVLVLGTAPGSLARWALGSVAERVCHRPTATTVIVCPKHPLTDAPIWVVGVDYSNASDRAAKEAIHLARIAGAKLHFVHIVSAPSPVLLSDPNIVPIEADSKIVETALASGRQRMNVLMDQLESQLKGIEYTSDVITGYPILTLAEFVAEKQADAIVVGSVGRSRLGDFIMGSVTNGLVKRVPATIIIVPGG